MACPLCGNERHCSCIRLRESSHAASTGTPGLLRGSRRASATPHHDPEVSDPQAFERGGRRHSVASEACDDPAEARVNNHRVHAGHAQSSLPSHTVTTSPRAGEQTAPGPPVAMLAFDRGACPAQPSGIERTFAERPEPEATLPSPAEFWRQEVANRVEGYRNRRSRKRLAGQFSMRLDFEPPSAFASALDSVPSSRNAGGAPAVASEFDHGTAPLPPSRPPRSGAALPAIAANPDWDAVASSSSASGRLQVPQRSRGTVALAPAAAEAAGRRSGPAVHDGNVIRFPRSPVFPEFADDPHELAEPVFNKPRILEVSEAIGSALSPLADITLQAEQEPESVAAMPPALELSLEPAPLLLRFAAALMDALVVAVATSVFATIILYSTDLPHTRPLLALAVASPVLFWAAYHYLFLVHAAATPGMMAAHMRVSTFDGARAPRSLRRWRALLMVLSCVSLGFGFLWVLFDQDRLCWHDKLTRTYLTPEP